MSQDSKKAPDCKVCMVQHDEEIHAATISVRQWFLGQVTKNFQNEDEYAAYEEQQSTVTAA